MARPVSAAGRRWASLLGTPIARTRAAATEVWEPAEVIALPGPWRNDTLTHWNQSSWNNYGAWADGTVYDRYTPNHYVVGCVAVTGAARGTRTLCPAARRERRNWLRTIREHFG